MAEPLSPEDLLRISAEAKAHLLEACRRILRPLMKIVVRTGLRHEEFSELVRGVYVETAVRDGLGPLGKATRARICFVTGISRRDIDLYIDDPSLLAPPAATDAKTLTEALHIWHTDPIYQGPYGMPLELDFRRSSGRSFRELIHRVNPHTDPIAALDELLRAGVVIGSAETSIKVLSRAYVVPDQMSPPMLEHFGTTIENLAATIAHNVTTEEGDKRLERSVFADRGLPEEAFPSFSDFLRRRVGKLIEDIDDWLGELAKIDWPPDTKRIETGLTLFHFAKSNKPLPPLDSLIDKK